MKASFNIKPDITDINSVCIYFYSNPSKFDKFIFIKHYYKLSYNGSIKFVKIYFAHINVTSQRSRNLLLFL